MRYSAAHSGYKATVGLPDACAHLVELPYYYRTGYTAWETSSVYITG
ncbi:MAG TPA: hypothetical protein VGW38_00150 [Chloroflexota bacterium]|nr:hypothetical protein [Chloroflexota bacterium]